MKKIISVVIIIAGILVTASCKKEKTEPKAAAVVQVPEADSPGDYYGRLMVVMTVNHYNNPIDTSLSVDCKVYKTPVNAFTQSDILDSAFVNNYELEEGDSSGYYPNPFYDYTGRALSQFENVHWRFFSQSTGAIAINDNQAFGMMSNAGSVMSPTMSVNAPCTFTISNLSNCTYGTVYPTDRVITPGNNTVTLYPQDYAAALPGYIGDLWIQLVSEQDVIVNGKKFKLVKIIQHDYRFTFTN